MAASPSSHPATSPHSSTFGSAQASSAVPPLDITLAGILTELSLCHHRAQQVHNQLTQLTAQHQQTTELVLPMLASLSSSLPAVSSASASLSSILDNSALSASALSSQVRTLDLTQSRLLAALRRVSALLDLKDTIATVHKLREAGQWDAAVRELHRVLYLQRTIEDSNYSKLREMEEEVRNELLRLLQHSQQRAEWKEVMSYARLLPYVDRTFAGLSAYCSAIRALLSATLTSKALTLKSQPPSSVIPYPHLLTSQLDHVAHSLKQQLQPVQQFFGQGSHLRLLQEIQAECDLELAPLLRQFVVDKHVQQMVQQVRSVQQRQNALKKAGGSAGSAGGKVGSVDVTDVDVRVLDALLTEIAFLTRESDLFDSNMRTLAKQAENALHKAIEQEEKAVQQLQHSEDHAAPTSPSSSSSSSSSSPASPPRLTTYYHLSAVLSSLSSSHFGVHLSLHSPLRDACHELLGHYISLEEHYLLTNVDKAMRIDVHEGADTVDEDDDDAAEEERRRIANLSRVQAISDKLTTNISNINLVSQATSSSIGMAIPSNPAAPQTISLTFLRRFRTSLTSTLVDDTFFILKKSTERSFSTYSTQASAAIVNHMNSLLQGMYYDALEAPCIDYEKKYQPANKRPVFSSSNERASGGLVQLLVGGGGQGLASLQMKKLNDDTKLMVTYNNIALTMDHIILLQSHLAHEFHSINAQGGETNTAMIDACLDDLSITLHKIQSLQGKATQLMINLLTIPWRIHMMSFLHANYELTEADYMQAETSDPYVSSLIDTIDRTFLPLRSILIDKNFIILLTALLTYMTTKLESMVWKKKFNVWGGLQLDRDIRRLVGWWSGINGDVNVREKMMRLVQIGNVLQIEKVSEMREMWGDEAGGGQGAMWRLHEGEIKKILSLRSDLPAKDIAALNLR